MNKTNNAEYWKDVIKRQEESKQHIRPWCIENDVPISSYYKWKKRLKDPVKEKEHFLPVMMKIPTDKQITLEVNGITIQCNKDLLPDIIQSIK